MDYVKELQRFAISLLKKDNHEKTLSVLSKWNCSEISRIIGLKVLSEVKESDPVILKGKVTTTGLTTENFHDVLAFKLANHFVIVDPTIWQFFPKKKSILLYRGITLQKGLGVLKIYYGSKFKESEKVTPKMQKGVSEWKKIIKLNTDQSPNWKS